MVAAAVEEMKLYIIRGHITAVVLSEEQAERVSGRTKVAATCAETNSTEMGHK